MDADFERSATDWARLRVLDDEQIARAVAVDDDSYLVETADVLGHREAGYRYVIYMDASRRWRWKLASSDGHVIAQSGEAMRTKAAATASIATARRLLLGASLNV